MFNFRDKGQRIGIIMGSLCFLPSFLVVLYLAEIKYYLLGLSVLLITMSLWILSIFFCMRSLEAENKTIKEENKNLLVEIHKLPKDIDSSMQNSENNNPIIIDCDSDNLNKKTILKIKNQKYEILKSVDDLDCIYDILGHEVIRHINNKNRDGFMIGALAILQGEDEVVICAKKIK